MLAGGGHGRKAIFGRVGALTWNARLAVLVPASQRLVPASQPAGVGAADR